MGKTKTDKVPSSPVYSQHVAPVGNHYDGVERSIAFYIEIYEETSAYYMAARLQKEHWEVNVIPTGSRWICLLHAIVTPDHETINDLCDYLSDLSEFYGGSFEKWELGSLS